EASNHPPDRCKPDDVPSYRVHMVKEQPLSEHLIVQVTGHARQGPEEAYLYFRMKIPWQLRHLLGGLGRREVVISAESIPQSAAVDGAPVVMIVVVPQEADGERGQTDERSDTERQYEHHSPHGQHPARTVLDARCHQFLPIS